jgi:MFS family permease
MAESTGLAILAFMPHPPLAGLYALATAGGIFLAFDNPLRRSFVSEMVVAEDLPNAVVLYSGLVNTTRILGPAIAGLLVLTVGYGWCFTLDAISYLAVLFSLCSMRPDELHRRPPKRPAKGEVREGLCYILSIPSLWITFAMIAVTGTLTYNFNVSLPLFVTDTLHRSSEVFTVLYSVFSFGAVVSALIVARRGYVQMRHIILGAAALGLTMLLLGSTSLIWAALPAAFLVGMSSILYMTSITAMVQIESKPDMRGRVLSLQTMIQLGSSALGGPLLGRLADVMGGRVPIMLGAIASLIAAAFGYYMNRRQAS